MTDRQKFPDVVTNSFQIFCKLDAIYSISCSLINNPTSSPVLLAYCNHNTALIRTPFYTVYYSFLKIKSGMVLFSGTDLVQCKYNCLNKVSQTMHSISLSTQYVGTGVQKDISVPENISDSRTMSQ